MRIFLKIVLAGFIVVFSTNAHAQGIIRDAEIESYLREMSTPIFQVAGLNSQDVQLVLVNDNRLNAFVAGGQNIFINTGLILETGDVGELIGVIAHETGHIAAGHLVRSREIGKRASSQAILSTILGAAVGLAGGGVEAAAGVIATGQGAAISYGLGNSRTFEASADQAAVAYLDDAGYSGYGMARFLERLGAQELLPASQQVDYLRTHPITRERVESVTAAVNQTRHKDTVWPTNFVEYHQIMQAKILSFTNPDRALRDYEGQDDLAANYAIAIAHYRKGDVEKALSGMEDLLEQDQSNPYFYETKGQILFENSRIEEAITAYRKAVDLSPKSALIRLALGQALLQRNDNGLLGEAIKNLTLAGAGEETSPRLHRLLATAYGRAGQDGLAKLHLAEEALLRRDIPFAIQQARLAQEVLEKDSGTWQRAADILKEINNKK